MLKRVNERLKSHSTVAHTNQGKECDALQKRVQPVSEIYVVATS